MRQSGGDDLPFRPEYSRAAESAPGRGLRQWRSQLWVGVGSPSISAALSPTSFCRRPSGFFSGKVLTTGRRPARGRDPRHHHGAARRPGCRPDEVDLTIHGTTLATNAIIERRGARTALLTTQGFSDTLEFAFGHRFDQYDLEMVRPPAAGARGRCAWKCPSALPPTAACCCRSTRVPCARSPRTLREQTIQSVAVSFMHSYREPAHELRVRAILEEECPDLYVSLSHESLSGDPRIRTHVDDGRQRLYPAADGELSAQARSPAQADRICAGRC